MNYNNYKTLFAIKPQFLNDKRLNEFKEYINNFNEYVDKYFIESQNSFKR